MPHVVKCAPSIKLDLVIIYSEFVSTFCSNYHFQTNIVPVHEIFVFVFAQTCQSFCIRTVLPEPWLLIYKKYGCRSRFRINFRPLAQLDMSAWAFKGVFFAYAIGTEILCTGSNIYPKRFGLKLLTIFVIILRVSMIFFCFLSLHLFFIHKKVLYIYSCALLHFLTTHSTLFGHVTYSQLTDKMSFTFT